MMKMLWKMLCLLCLISILTVPVRADDMPQQEKVIYLTFDDGPSPYTRQLLRVLARYNAEATFFLVNTGVDMDEILGEMVRGGHSVGIHSLSHDFKRIYKSEAAFWEDLRAMQNLIREKTGITTMLMRFPGGSSNTISRRFCPGIMTRLVKNVTEAGFSYFDWNVDSGDASGCSDTDQIVQNVISGIRGKDLAVVLQHDIHGCSVRAVERILIWGLENGYQFRALTELSPVCHHSVQN